MNDNLLGLHSVILKMPQHSSPIHHPLTFLKYPFRDGATTEQTMIWHKETHITFDGWTNKRQTLSAHIQVILGETPNATPQMSHKWMSEYTTTVSTQPWCLIVTCWDDWMLADCETGEQEKWLRCPECTEECRAGHTCVWPPHVRCIFSYNWWNINIVFHITEVAKVTKQSAQTVLQELIKKKGLNKCEELKKSVKWADIQLTNWHLPVFKCNVIRINLKKGQFPWKPRHESWITELLSMPCTAR